MTDALYATAAGPLNCDCPYGTLTIGLVSLHTAAWCAVDLSDLWNTPALRGSNRLIPGRQGRKAYKRRLDQTVHSLPMLISGFCDPEGIDYADLGKTYDEGLEANVAYLLNNVGLPNADTTDSTREATWVLPSGNVRRSTVQCALVGGQLMPGFFMRSTLEVTDVDAQLIVGGENFVE